MDVAISGDRSSCLTQQLAPETYLFAVAHGFGTIDGEPIARAVLGRVRSQFERKARGDRFRRFANRPKTITKVMVQALDFVNSRIHARSASHEDYVTAGCSLTGVLLVNQRAYLAHIGSTAAYLSRDGSVVSLTKTDTFESEGLPVLTRALGASPALDVAVCSFTLNDGDALVLSGRRLRDPLHSAHDEQVLVVHYAAGEQPQAPEASKSHTLRALARGLFATMLFFTLLCLK
jgi:serine/threonine protein phosphatase PrpC